MDLEQRTDGDIIVLLVSGDLTLKNAWGSPLADSVRSAIQLGHARFVIDLGGVKNVDSMGISCHEPATRWPGRSLMEVRDAP